LVTYQINCP